MIEGSKNDGARLFSVTPSDKIRIKGHKFKKIPLNYKKITFTVIVVRDWNRLPREVVMSPSLEIFKTQLNMVLH